MIDSAMSEFDMVVIYAIMGLTIGLLQIIVSMSGSYGASLCFSLISIGIYSFVISARDVNIGADTATYLNMYNDVGFYSESVEFGYIWLLKLISSLGVSDAGYLFINSLLINTILFIGYRRFNIQLAGLSFGLLTSLPVFWISNILLLRNGLAASIVASSILLLSVDVNASERRWLKYASIMSIPFHYSTVAHSILIQIFLKIKRGDVRYAVLAAVIVALLLFITMYLFGSLLEPWTKRYDDYNQYAKEGVGSFSMAGVQPHHAIPLFIGVGCYFLRTRFTTSIRNLTQMYFMIVLASLVFASNPLFRDRIYIPAQLLEPVIIASILKCWLSRGGYIVVSIVIFISLSAVTLFYWGPRNVLQVYAG